MCMHVCIHAYVYRHVQKSVELTTDGVIGDETPELGFGS